MKQNNAKGKQKARCVRLIEEAVMESDMNLKYCDSIEK